MKILRKAFSVIAPPICAGCGREGKVLCADCGGRLVAPVQTCYRCNALTDGRTCKSCRHAAPIYAAFTAGRYEGAVKNLLQAAKYGNDHSATDQLATMMLSELPLAGADIVVPVPPAPQRYRQRGGHMAGKLAKHLALGLQLPLVLALVRTETRPQVGSSRAERWRSVRQAYAAAGARPVVSQSVLLVDDVLTTGATAAACAEALKSAGAGRITVAVAARRT